MEKGTLEIKPLVETGKVTSPEKEITPETLAAYNRTKRELRYSNDLYQQQKLRAEIEHLFDTNEGLKATVGASLPKQEKAMPGIPRQEQKRNKFAQWYDKWAFGIPKNEKISLGDAKESFRSSRRGFGGFFRKLAYGTALNAALISPSAEHTGVKAPETPLAPVVTEVSVQKTTPVSTATMERTMQYPGTVAVSSEAETVITPNNLPATEADIQKVEGERIAAFGALERGRDSGDPLVSSN